MREIDKLFLKIIKREIKADIVYEDDFLIAFKDIAPKARVHVLIVPKKHIATLNQLTAEDEALAGKLLLAAGKIAKLLNIDNSGYRVIMNCNQDGGQEIYHLHLHLIGGEKIAPF